MLSVFPEILFLSPFSALIIRIALAAVFAYCAWKHAQRTDIPSRVLAAPELAVAAALFLGLWTQPAALLGAVIAVVWLFQPSSRVHARSTIFLTLVMALSLILTGAGALAFDLPL